MAGRSGTVLGHLHQLLAARGADGQTDGHLLDRFVTQQEESAFTALVQRHGPLVLRVCRRLLGNTADADDAFQATFLVLVRKARTLDKRGSLAGWLYGVAYRIAVRARAQAAQRRTYERQAAQMQTRKAVPEPPDPALRELLDEELSRLPEKYRSPVVLCYLEGKTYAEAARQLRWPLGTVRGRVARARILLRKRFTRRGLAVPIGLFGTVWASDTALAGVPTALMQATTRAALLTVAGNGAVAGAFSAHVIALGEAALKELAIGRLKTVFAVLLGFTVLGTGAGLLTQQAARSDRPERPANAETPQEVAPRPETERLIPRLATQFRHGGEIRSIALAPDGTTLAFGGADATIRLWDLTATPIRERTHWKRPSPVFAVTFSAGGKFLAAGSVGNDKVALWEAATGREVDHPFTGNNSVRRLAFSPKGDVLAAGGYSDLIHVWEFANRRKRHTLPFPGTPNKMGINCLAFTPDGTKLAAAGIGEADRAIHLWDVGTGQKVQTFQGHQGWVNTLAFFPDGKHLASGSEDRTICVWNVATGRAIRRWQGHAQGVSYLALFRDGKTLASVGGEPVIRLWDAATGKESRQLAGHSTPVVALALSRDGSTLASGGKDGSILLWKLDPEK
jgi:RNA polymerase sigma factor (sigma-70 family)